MNPYLFIVGCPRSGTTLLGRMVDAHPDIAVIHEGRFAPDWFERRRGLTEEGFVTPELVDRLLGHEPFKNVAVGREELERLLGDRGRVTYADFVAGIFDLHGRAHGKRLVGDKTPHYVRSLTTLHGLWPAARIVHLIRDGRDVAQSVLGWRKVTERGGSVARFATFREDPVATVACWWEWLVRLGREDGAALGPALYHEIRYESLVSEPRAECERLCGFLGVPYDERMVAFHEGRERDDPGLDAKKAWRPVTPGLRDWPSEMAPADVERFEAAAGGLLDELGYERGSQAPSAETSSRAARVRSSLVSELQDRRRRRLPSSWKITPPPGADSDQAEAE
ncbi:MAG: sulfotransferase family protein [Thermoleophilaceae bacterium]